MNKGNIIRIFFSLLTVVGAIAFVKYSGAVEALHAQEDVAYNGYYYSGETWMTPDNFNQLKDSLAQRNQSLQTSMDLQILPDIRDGKLLVKYSFYSVDDYAGLSKTKELPSIYRLGNGLANVVFIMILITFIFLIVRIWDSHEPIKEGGE